MKRNHTFGRKQVRAAFLVALGLGVGIGGGSRQVHADALPETTTAESAIQTDVTVDTDQVSTQEETEASLSGESVTASDIENEVTVLTTDTDSESEALTTGEAASEEDKLDSESDAQETSISDNSSTETDTEDASSETDAAADDAEENTSSDELAEEEPEEAAEETEDVEEEKTFLSILDGVDYSPVYNYSYYKNRYSDLAAAFGDDQAAMLQHFLLFGMSEERQASESFSEVSYRLAYQDLRLAFGKDYAKYYYHYLTSGIKENRVTTGVTTLQNPVTVQDGVDYALVYDYTYYTQHNQDVAKYYGQDDIGILNHFVTFGMSEQRQAISTFNEKSYRYTYPDLRLAFGSDYSKYYLHYINSGKKENRKTTGTTSFTPIVSLNGTNYSSVYNFAYYIGHYADLKKLFSDDDAGAIKHFVNYGMREERQAIATFDEKSYRRAYQDLRIAFEDNYAKYYEHYMQFGAQENRITTGVATVQNPVTILDGSDYADEYEYFSYLKENPDVEKLYGENDVAVLRYYVSTLIPAKARRFLEAAQSWLGCNEKDGSFKEIIDTYNSYKPARDILVMKYSYEWCAAFVSACGIKAGLTDIIQCSPLCGQMVNFYKKLGEWVENDAYTPDPGDIIMYDWDDSGKGDCTGWPDHVGIVESVKNGVITVIEGNYSERVARRTIKVNAKYIRGFCTPNFGN